VLSGPAQARIDPMALGEADSDDDDVDKRASFEEDSSDEDLDSAVTIRQQAGPLPTVSQPQDQVENMDVSSSDG